MKHKLILIFLFLIAIFYRIPRVVGPMWVDEYSSAHQARIWAEVGFGGLSNPDIYLEPNNILFHWILIPIGQLFSGNALALRMPSILFGSLLVPVVYLFTRKYFSQLSAFIASFLVITSYSLITWSQQARGYALHQLLMMIWLWVFMSWLKDFKKFKLVGLLLVGILGFLTHITFVMTIVASIFYLLIFHFSRLKSLLVKHKYIISGFLISIGALGIFFHLDKSIGYYLKYLWNVRGVNNLAYYHSFLWRSQTLITLLATIGLLFAVRQGKRVWQLLIAVVGAYLFFFTFIFGPTSTRYLVIIWPILFIFSGVALANLAKIVTPKSSWHFSKYLPTATAMLMTLVVVASGHWFTLKPKPFYSVNYFFREIAVLDYNAIYAPVIAAVQSSDEPIGLIDSWKDRALWYFPEHTQHVAVFRWEDEGLMKQSPYNLDEDGVKRLKQSQQIRLISTVADLEKYMSLYPQGFIYIDDDSLPADVIEYAEDNFELVLEVDRLDMEPNVYAVWPAKLYKWNLDR